MEVKGGHDVVRFDPSIGENGCKELTVMCGLEDGGTETVLQVRRDFINSSTETASRSLFHQKIYLFNDENGIFMFIAKIAFGENMFTK
jgi:hypothetical protein